LRLFRGGDGNGKINCNTASRDDNGHGPDVGGVYGNPRPLRNAKRNIAHGTDAHATTCGFNRNGRAKSRANVAPAFVQEQTILAIGGATDAAGS
jgi:hypothetical protein